MGKDIVSLAVDLILVVVIVFFAWRGFQKGFIRGVLGLVAVVVAIYGANLAAKTYSGEFTGMLEPIVGGIVDKAVSGAADDAETPEDDDAPEDGGPSDVFDVSFDALRHIGISGDAAGKLAEKVGAEINTVGEQMKNSLTEKLSGTLAYIAVFGASFLLILIIFAVIGKLVRLAYIIPGIETADRLIGLILGVLKGALIVFALAVVIRYAGLLSPEAVGKTTLLKYITDFNPLADILGI